MDEKIFKIKTDKIMHIQELIVEGIFDWYQLKSEQPGVTENSLITDATFVLLGLKEESTFGFEVSYCIEEKAYVIKIIDIATISDWSGVLVFLKTLSILVDADIVDENERVYDSQTILNYDYTHLLIEAIKKLAKEIFEENIIHVFQGIHRPIYIGADMLIAMSENDRLLSDYDNRLRLTQCIKGYYSEQGLLEDKTDEKEVYISVNYFSLGIINFLPLSPEVLLEYNTDISVDKVKKFLIYIMDDQDLVAEIDYQKFISLLPTEKYFLIDELTLMVEPMTLEELDI